MPLIRASQIPEVVPFGKYRGQPIEQLAADPEYCQWLMGQSWFVDKFAAIHTLIINNFGEPNETPEHNRLQLRFLDETFRRQCMQAAGVQGYYCSQPLPDFEFNGIDVRWLMEGWYLGKEDSSSEDTTIFHKEWQKRDWAFSRASSQYEHAKQVLRKNPIQIQEYIKFIEKETNSGGMDWYRTQIKELRRSYKNAYYNFSSYKKTLDTYKILRDNYYTEYATVFHNTVISTTYRWYARQHYPYTLKSIGIECKPVLGDDYPAVLRFMRNIRTRPEIYCLVIGRLTSQAASLEQLKVIFAQANITLLSVAEIETTPPLRDWTFNELPNPLEENLLIDSSK